MHRLFFVFIILISFLFIASQPVFAEVHEKTSPGFKIAGQDEWNHYLGVLKGNGVSVYDLKRLPDDIVLNIIKSIEFQN